MILNWSRIETKFNAFYRNRCIYIRTLLSMTAGPSLIACQFSLPSIGWRASENNRIDKANESMVQGKIPKESTLMKRIKFNSLFIIDMMFIVAIIDWNEMQVKSLELLKPIKWYAGLWPIARGIKYHYHQSHSIEKPSASLRNDSIAFLLIFSNSLHSDSSTFIYVHTKLIFIAPNITWYNICATVSEDSIRNTAYNLYIEKKINIYGILHQAKGWLQ